MRWEVGYSGGVQTRFNIGEGLFGVLRKMALHFPPALSPFYDFFLVYSAPPGIRSYNAREGLELELVEAYVRMRRG